MSIKEQNSLWDESAVHASTEQLNAALVHIKASPSDHGTLEMIVCRPAKAERRFLQEGVLDTVEGLLGDNWLRRGSSSTPDRSAHPDMQINLMNARVAQAIARERSRWALAGDQLYVDLDLSETNLPPGSRLQIGDALLEITAEPHLGCKYFSERFGRDAVRWVNSNEGKALHLRGLNARVICGGTICSGDIVRKISRA
jgi:hypothetical protein